MSNPYYTYSGNFIPGALARAETVAAEYQAVEQGFNDLSYQQSVAESGAANAYVVTTPYSPATSYADGDIVEFKPSNSATGASTINVNGIGAVGLKRWDGSAIQSGDLPAGTWVRAMYDGTYWRVIAPAAFTALSGSISGAAPTHKVGLTAAAGTAVAAMPIDATLAIDQAIAPTWTGAHTFSAGVSVAAGSGVAAAITGVAGQYGAKITGSSTSGQSYGLDIAAGTTSADRALNITNQAASATLLALYGDGGAVMGAPTGGDKGAGTINVAGGFYVNGVAVGTAANPTASVGLAAINGTAATYMRSDAAPALNVGIAPTWTGAHTFAAAGTGLTVSNNATISGALTVSNNATISGALTVSTGGSSIKGGLTIAAPASGDSLTANAVAGGNSLILSSPNTAGQSFGIRGLAGTNSGDYAVYFTNAANTHALLLVSGDGSFDIGFNGSSATLTGSASGAVTISAPSSGTALSVTGSANALTASLQASTAAGQSFGMRVFAGTNSGDEAFRVFNAAGSQTYLEVRGDGLVSAVDDGGTPQAVGWRGTPINVQNGAYTLALADRGKAVFCTVGSQTYTVPANVFGASDVVTIVCLSGGAVTIAPGAGVTVEWANGTATTGSRTLTSVGIATLLFASATTALITGSGLS